MWPGQPVGLPEPLVWPADDAPVRRPVRSARLARVTLLAGAGLLIAGGYAAWQRFGTVADVTHIETFEDYSGGFVAVGLSPDKPGFLCLSRVPRDQLELVALHHENWLAGSWTTLMIRTAGGQWKHRLRGPVVILVDRRGRVDAVPVHWPRARFIWLRDCVDCERGSVRRCGRPLDDLAERLAAQPPDLVPPAVLAFLQRPMLRRDDVHRAPGAEKIRLSTRPAESP